MIGDGPVGVHLLTWLGGQSFILLFLVVAAGYALGRVKIKGIGLGARSFRASTSFMRTPT